MTTETIPQTSAHETAWKSFLALGVCLLLLGISGLTIAGVLELTSVLVFGPLLLVSSLVQLLTAFFTENGKESRLHFAAAGLEALLGFFIMANPLQQVIGLVALIGMFLVVIGIIRLARSLLTESRGRGWTVLAGVVSVLLGICIWTGWPDSRLWFVGVCLAIDFICHGVSWSALALTARKPQGPPA